MSAETRSSQPSEQIHPFSPAEQQQQFEAAGNKLGNVYIPTPAELGQEMKQFDQMPAPDSSGPNAAAELAAYDQAEARATPWNWVIPADERPLVSAEAMAENPRELPDHRAFVNYKLNMPGNPTKQEAFISYRTQAQRRVKLHNSLEQAVDIAEQYETGDTRNDLLIMAEALIIVDTKESLLNQPKPTAEQQAAPDNQAAQNTQPAPEKTAPEPAPVKSMDEMLAEISDIATVRDGHAYRPVSAANRNPDGELMSAYEVEMIHDNQHDIRDLTTAYDTEKFFAEADAAREAKEKATAKADAEAAADKELFQDFEDTPDKGDSLEERVAENDEMLNEETEWEPSLGEEDKRTMNDRMTEAAIKAISLGQHVRGAMKKASAALRWVSQKAGAVASTRMYYAGQTAMNAKEKVDGYYNDDERGEVRTKRTKLLAKVAGVTAVAAAGVGLAYMQFHGHAPGHDVADYFPGRGGAGKSGANAGEQLANHAGGNGHTGEQQPAFVKAKLEKQGDTIWEDAAKLYEKKGYDEKYDSLNDFVQDILKKNGLTEEEARKLPVGYEYEIPGLGKAEKLADAKDTVEELKKQVPKEEKAPADAPAFENEFKAFSEVVLGTIDTAQQIGADVGDIARDAAEVAARTHDVGEIVRKDDLSLMIGSFALHLNAVELASGTGVLGALNEREQMRQFQRIEEVEQERQRKIEAAKAAAAVHVAAAAKAAAYKAAQKAKQTGKQPTKPAPRQPATT
ncbi:MAG TPA: hypothetical protein VF572_05665 [Candidatus Saccharimonadales bacterium]|jgi:hypothetical protein